MLGYGGAELSFRLEPMLVGVAITISGFLPEAMSTLGNFFMGR